VYQCCGACPPLLLPPIQDVYSADALSSPPAAHVPLFLYPFLNTTSKTRPFEYLRLTSLGVIGALVKVPECCWHSIATTTCCLLLVRALQVCTCHLFNPKLPLCTAELRDHGMG